MALKLIYKDVALGAAEDATKLVSASEKENFSDQNYLTTGAPAPAIATLEPNGWGLDGNYEVLNGKPFAFCSTARSGADCVIATPPTIRFTFSQQHTATGLTIDFSSDSMDYCTEIEVEWWQNGELKASGVYQSNSPEFIVEETVEAFDDIRIRFTKTNLPGKRVKVAKVTFGVSRTFDGKELVGGAIIQEVDLISDTVPTNVLDVTLRGSKRGDYVFQRKQPVEAYNDDELLGVFYVEKGTRTGWNNYTLACTDAVGVLGFDEYAGGLWLEDTQLTAILRDVFGYSIEFEIDPAVAGAMRGYIEPGTKRDALRAIAFAAGAVVDTSGTHKIRLFPMPTGDGVEIPEAETYVGGAVDIADKVTEVTVTSYKIENARPSGDDEYIEFNGVKYRYTTETKHAYNPDTVAADPPHKVKFMGNYLVNSGNAQKLANKIMSYYMRRETYRFKHIMGEHKPGDRAVATLPWGDTVPGNIKKVTISATGLVVGDVEMVLD